MLELLLLFFDLPEARDFSLLAGEVVVDHALGDLGVGLLLREHLELISRVLAGRFDFMLVLRGRLDLPIQFKPLFCTLHLITALLALLARQLLHRARRPLLQLTRRPALRVRQAHRQHLLGSSLRQFTA